MRQHIHFIQRWRRQITLCGRPTDSVTARLEQTTVDASRATCVDCRSILSVVRG